MESNTKYVWDITAEKRFSERQLEIVDEIAFTISKGGNIQEMKKKLEQLKLL